MLSMRELTLLAVAFFLAVSDAGHTKELYWVRKPVVAVIICTNTYRLDLLDTQLV